MSTSMTEAELLGQLIRSWQTATQVARQASSEVTAATNRANEAEKSVRDAKTKVDEQLKRMGLT